MAEKNRLYPHLMPGEIPIWEAWLEDHKSDFDRFNYDVRVGESIIPPPHLDANLADMAVSLAKKRIDVVGYKGNDPTVIEIKPYAGLTTLGQLLAYPVLYRWEFPGMPPPKVLLITPRLMPDMANLFYAFEIPFNIVETS